MLVALASMQVGAGAPATELDVTLDPAGRRIAGHARLRVVNDSGAPLRAVNLWLYPNALARRSPALNDINFHWLYPGGFSPGDMSIANARVDGAPVAAVVVATRLGERTGAELPLAAPLPPGGAVTVDVDFETRIPRRFGAFGCDGVRCRLMGGFHPLAARQSGVAWKIPPEVPPVPRAGSLRLTLRLPASLALVVGGRPIALPGGPPGADASVTFESDDALYPTIVTDRVLRPSTVTAGGHAITYLHRRPRPPPSNDQVLPYTREDIPGLVLETARRAASFGDQFLQRLGVTAPAVRGLPITLVEAPLRHELVQAHGDVVLVSDQIFGIFPLARLRGFHRLELARAVFATLIDARIAPTESPDDRERTAGVLAAWMTDLFAAAEVDRVAYAGELLRPFDFVPAVDQLIYAPLLASTSTYFADVDAADRTRDGVRRFADPDAGASPRLVYNKLLDLLGPPGLDALARGALAEGLPLRAAAARAFGAELGWFWDQWLRRAPRVNYRLDGVRVRPGPRGSHVTIDVRREGEPVREPVEIAVSDRAGGTQTLRWAAAGGADRQRFEVELPAGLAAVEVDPRGRLVETASASAELRASDDPRLDNRTPPRWRFVYRGFGALLNLSQITANIVAGFVFKPQYDLRRRIVATAFHTDKYLFGASAAYGWGFGGQADRNNLTTLASVGLAAARLDPDFGRAPGQSPQPGTRVSAQLALDHDTRDYLFDPWRAVGFNAAAGAALTWMDTGERLSQVDAAVEALRLFELAPGHVLALDAQATATVGDVRLPAQLIAMGGPLGLRGYQPDELLARAGAIGRIQLRNDYVAGLDWNLLHFTTVRGLAGTLFADVAAISTCDGYAFSKDRLYADAGYSFRVLHDAFGVYQQLLSIDFAVPINRHDPYASCLGQPPAAGPRPAFNVFVSFFPNF